MFVGIGNSGQYELNIIHLKYDTTVSDRSILLCIDSLPGGLFHSKMYNLLYADDSTKLAIQVNEGNYLFHTRYEVVEYYKNGNVKRRTHYSKHLKRYWEFNYYTDASPKSKGKYKTFIIRDHFSTEAIPDNKNGKWMYFNTDGKLIRKEKYSGGTLKSSKDYNPPKRTFATTSNPRHPKGRPYVIQ
jgi:antitoxin component YwqK of YwqJK toxin-antitoxin module